MPDADIAELTDNRTYVIDKNGAEAATRTFRVLNAGSEVGAKNKFYERSDYLLYPGSEGMVLDRVQVENRAGNNLWIVKASYSTFGGFTRLFTGGGGNRTYTWGWDYKVVTVQIPFMSESSKLLLGGSTSGGSVSYWSVKIVNIQETRVIRTLDLVHTADNTNEFDVIAAQHNKYHYIGGKWVLFRGAQVRRDASVAGQYAITYTWEQDMGTVHSATESSAVYLSGNAKPPRAVPVTGYRDTGVVLGIDYTRAEDQSYSRGAYIIRPPNYRLDVVVTNNASTGNLDQPRAVGLLDFEADAEGWMGLPGVMR